MGRRTRRILCTRAADVSPPSSFPFGEPDGLPMCLEMLMTFALTASDTSSDLPLEGSPAVDVFKAPAAAVVALPRRDRVVDVSVPGRVNANEARRSVRMSVLTASSFALIWILT